MKGGGGGGGGEEGGQGGLKAQFSPINPCLASYL